MYQDSYWHSVAYEMLSFAGKKYKDYEMVHFRRMAEKLVLRSINWADTNTFLLAKHYNLIVEIERDRQKRSANRDPKLVP